MPEIENFPVDMLVYGAGAVGMSVALEASLGLGDNLRIRAFNRTRLFRMVRLFSETLALDIQKTISCQPLDDLEDELGDFRSSLGLVVVTPPPHQLDLAVRTLAHALGSQNSRPNGSSLPTNLEVVILGNGLVEDSTLALLRLAECDEPGKPIVTWHRGLVVVGLKSKWDPQTLELQISHTGGHGVYCGQYDTTNSVERPQAPILRGPLFRATALGAVRTLELQKFFANTLLAWIIGPNDEVNAIAKKRLSSQRAWDLAQEFGHIFPEAGATQDLVRFFWAVVEETANNINSASRAWRDGDPALAYYFRDTVLRALASQRHPVRQSDSPLRAFFEEQNQ